MDAQELKRAVLTLHKYFLWANLMHTHFYELVPKIAALETPNRFSTEVLEADVYMSLWYGQLYVLIEGWRELGLSDPTIDTLLRSPNVELLKRFRNGALHFQKEYFDERFLGFMRDGQNSAQWANELHQAFSAFFLDRFRSEKPNPQP